MIDPSEALENIDIPVSPAHLVVAAVVLMGLGGFAATLLIKKPWRSPVTWMPSPLTVMVRPDGSKCHVYAGFRGLGREAGDSLVWKCGPEPVAPSKVGP